MATQTKKMTYCALMIAVTFVMTTVIKIPIPNGYVHLGDGAVLLCAYILGPGEVLLRPLWAQPVLIILADLEPMFCQPLSRKALWHLFSATLLNDIQTKTSYSFYFLQLQSWSLFTISRKPSCMATLQHRFLIFHLTHFRV